MNFTEYSSRLLDLLGLAFWDFHRKQFRKISRTEESSMAKNKYVFENYIKFVDDY